MNDIIISNSNVTIESGGCRLLYAYRKHRNRIIYRANKILKQKIFKKSLKIGSWRFYITKNLKLKNQTANDRIRPLFDTKFYKGVLISKRGCKCEICGMEVERRDKIEMHHVLPFGRVKRYSMDERNLLLLCHDCHKEIHCNPFLQTKMIQRKCDEFGIQVSDYYNIYE